MRLSLRHKEAVWGYFFISPVILGLIIFTLGPILGALWLSFMRWDIFTPPKLVWLGNFKDIFFEDNLFPKSLWVTTYYVLGSVPVRMVLAFLLAMLLNTGIKGMSFFRTVYYLPSIVPAVANAVLWVWIFNVEFGLANVLLSRLHIPKLLWLQSEELVIPSLIIMSAWGIGQPMVIFLAGLQNIPIQLYEAADVDGANWWSKFWHITIPMMSPIIFFNFVLNIIYTFQVFSAGYLMTDGGPNNASLFYVLYIYRHTFQWLELGYGAALAWVLFVIILVITLLIFRYLGGRVYYEEAV
ncbi:MAG: carbohydrate ABC transporter permease [bacterium]